MNGTPSLLKKDYTFLDEAEVQNQYTQNGDVRRMRFFVGGVRCANCLRKVEGLAESMPGLVDLRFEMSTHLAHVEIDPNVTSFSKVAQAIANLGFQVTPIAKTSDMEDADTKRLRQDLIRLAIAGACAGNIMGFAFASYFGAQPTLQPYFAWLSFALYLPVVTFVAWPFYQGAWHGLRRRQLSIDLPMAIASFGGFAFSTVQLIRGRPDIYFDSLSGFLFLILVARFIQRRLQRRSLDDERFFQEMYSIRKVSGSSWRWVTAESLQPGDKILVEQNEVVPADAQLLEEKSHFSLAWLSGEAKPRSFSYGAEIPAGAKLISAGAVMAFRRPLTETEFGKIIKDTREFALHKNQTIQISDRWAQRLLITVFSIGVVFLIG